MSEFDASTYRTASLEGWEGAAPGWVRHQEVLRELGMPVSHWMIEAISPQPGQRILELAAGLGETGMLAAELVAPIGGVIISDQSEAMLDGARARALALGLPNVEFQVLSAEWIDLPVASVDAVLCRWGYMLLADPAAALVETRRVLRPGGRVALAVWDALEHNPWAQARYSQLRAHGLAVASAPDEPGPFTLADPVRVRELLEQAGFGQVRVERVAVQWRHADFDGFWRLSLDLSPVFSRALVEQPRELVADVRAAVARELAPFLTADGTLAIPGRTLVAVASA
jgi:ubiquinone/menaquinone biosynthesis C-methylase UbiE